MTGSIKNVSLVQTRAQPGPFIPIGKVQPFGEIFIIWFFNIDRGVRALLVKSNSNGKWRKLRIHARHTHREEFHIESVLTNWILAERGGETIYFKLPIKFNGGYKNVCSLSRRVKEESRRINRCHQFNASSSPHSVINQSWLMNDYFQSSSRAHQLKIAFQLTVSAYWSGKNHSESLTRRVYHNMDDMFDITHYIPITFVLVQLKTYLSCHYVAFCNKFRDNCSSISF